MELNFDAQGLVPVVIQDWSTGEVLTLAYANAEAVAKTRETGELHLWSRSRNELWHKGATSGNTQTVRALRSDCDGDALLAIVEDVYKRQALAHHERGDLTAEWEVQAACRGAALSASDIHLIALHACG